MRAFGVYQVELPPGAETGAHDHAEDVSVAVRGSGVVVVDDDEVAIGPGTFIAVTPDSTRHVRAGDDGLVFIAICG